MHSDPSYDDPLDLSRFDDVYASAPSEEVDVPDGKYDVTIEKVELTCSQSSGNPMLKWTLRILDPDYAGRKLWRNNVIVTEENVGWLKRDLKKCGLTLEKFSDLPNRLAELLDINLVVTKKTNGEYMNVYFNRRLADNELPASPSTPF